MGRSTTVARWGSLALVTLLLLVSVLTSGSSVVAAGPGPVFSNLQASSTDVESGGTVFLAVHLTSSADIISNPAISFLFPDGTPGPSVLFNHVGGSLRDGDWQATLELSVYLPDGTYDVNDLRAVDAAGNLTVYNPEDEAANNPTAMVKSKLQAINVTSAPSSDPLEQVGTSAPKSASLSVTNPAQQPTTSAPIRVVPVGCLGSYPDGPFFTSIEMTPLNSTYAPGTKLLIHATIVDCGVKYDDLKVAKVELSYKCFGDTVERKLLADFARAKGFDFLTNPNYTATLQVSTHGCAKGYLVGYSRLQATDGTYHNTFKPGDADFPPYFLP